MTKNDLQARVNRLVRKAHANTSETSNTSGYAIKAWSSAEKTKSTPAFDSTKSNIIYSDFKEVYEALKSPKLAALGTYEITQIKPETSKND